MRIILLIDTADNKLVKIALQIDGKEDILELVPHHRRAQVILPAIEELIKKHNLSLKDIHEIKVNAGPGSFTGLRVGIAIANTLGYLLHIPINGKKVGELVEAVY